MKRWILKITAEPNLTYLLMGMMSGLDERALWSEIAGAFFTTEIYQFNVTGNMLAMMHPITYPFVRLMNSSRRQSFWAESPALLSHLNASFSVDGWQHWNNGETQSVDVFTYTGLRGWMPGWKIKGWALLSMDTVFTCWCCMLSGTLLNEWWSHL